MGMKCVWDTNALIYLQKGLVAGPLPQGQHFISIITEMELQSFAGLTAEQDRALRELLSDMRIVTINNEVKRETIQLRRTRRLRLPDAIIAATALSLDAELISNDAIFRSIPRLRSRPLPLKGISPAAGQ